MVGSDITCLELGATARAAQIDSQAHGAIAG